MPIITISRQLGSLGDEIARALSKRLNMELIGRERAIEEFLPEEADQHLRHLLTVSPKAYLRTLPDGVMVKDHIERKLKEFARKTPAVITGMGAQMVFKGDPTAINVRTIASQPTRTARIMERYGVGEAQAANIVAQTDRKHKRYIATLFGADWADPTLYDLTLNTDHLDVDGAAGIISAAAAEHASRAVQLPRQREQESPEFRHPAEEEFARILDLYHIDWKYEPKTFPVEWDAEGNVTMAFSPDFYLTNFDTYIEITTMDQRYVTRKNKKARKLRELYPGINVKIIYKKDFHALIKRFGYAIGSEEA